MLKGKYGFSLAETLVSLMIISVILVATMPVITLKKKTGADSKWQYTGNNADISYCKGGNCNIGIGGDPDSSATSGRLQIFPKSNALGLVVKGASGQTADLQQWQDNNGAIKAAVDKDGLIRSKGLTIRPTEGASPAFVLYDTGVLDMSNTMRAKTMVVTPNMTGPSNGNLLQEWRNDSVTPVASLDKNGLFTANSISADSIDVDTLTAPLITVHPGANEVSLNSNGEIWARWFIVRDPATGLSLSYLDGSGGVVGQYFKKYGDATPFITNDLDAHFRDVSFRHIYYSGNLTFTSDKRFKNVEGKYNKGLSEISKLNPVKFKYKESKKYNFDKDEHIGLIAQDVQAVLPEAVSKDKNGYLMLNTNTINIAAINAIKELKTKNDNLATENGRLEERIARLEKLNGITPPEREKTNPFNKFVNWIKSVFSNILSFLKK